MNRFEELKKDFLVDLNQPGTLDSRLESILDDVIRAYIAKSNSTISTRTISANTRNEEIKILVLEKLQEFGTKILNHSLEPVQSHIGAIRRGLKRSRRWLWVLLITLLITGIVLIVVSFIIYFLDKAGSSEDNREKIATALLTISAAFLGTLLGTIYLEIIKVNRKLSYLSKYEASCGMLKIMSPTGQEYKKLKFRLVTIFNDITKEVWS